MKIPKPEKSTTCVTHSNGRLFIIQDFDTFEFVHKNFRRDLPFDYGVPDGIFWPIVKDLQNRNFLINDDPAFLLDYYTSNHSFIMEAVYYARFKRYGWDYTVA